MEIVAGIIIELLALSGLVSDPSVMSSIGSAILAVGLVMLIREMRMERDPELKKRVETASRDERYAFISMKAKEAAFWHIYDHSRCALPGMPGTGIQGGRDLCGYIHFPAGHTLCDHVPCHGKEVLRGGS